MFAEPVPCVTMRVRAKTAGPAEKEENMASVMLTRVIEKMKLENLTPEIDIEKKRITLAEVNRPALQLAGYFEHFDATRLQIIGYVEYTYMENMTDDEKRKIYDTLLSHEGIPCVVFSRELQPDAIFMETAIKYQVPVLSTNKSTSSFMAEIIRWLSVKLAPCISVHGVLMDIYGIGVLITLRSSTTSSVTRRWPLLISSNAASDLPIPLSPVINTPIP